MTKRSKSRPGWRAWGVGLLTLVSAIGAGFVGAFFLLQPVTPPTLAAPEAITEAPVVLEDSTDEHNVRLTVKRSADVDLLSHRAGVITASSCTVGSAITSGTSVFGIDGRPVVLLSLSMPLWRDIALGDSGSDVAAVKAELNRLGFETTPGEALNWRDLSSVRSLLKQAGNPSTPDTVAMADFMWMSSPELTTSECLAQVGQRVEQDSPALSIEGGVEASFTDELTGLLSGARVLRIDDVEVALADDLTIPADSISAIVNTPTYATARADASDTAPIEITGTVALVSGVPLASLPPSAITVSSGTDGCVRAGSTIYGVRVVTSELGRTVVQFIEDNVPDHVALQAPASCA